MSKVALSPYGDRVTFLTTCVKTFVIVDCGQSVVLEILWYFYLFTSNSFHCIMINVAGKMEM